MRAALQTSFMNELNFRTDASYVKGRKIELKIEPGAWGKQVSRRKTGQLAGIGCPADSKRLPDVAILF